MKKRTLLGAAVALTPIFAAACAGRPEGPTVTAPVSPTAAPATSPADAEPAPGTNAAARFTIDPRVTLLRLGAAKPGGETPAVEHPIHRDPAVLAAIPTRDPAAGQPRLLPEESTDPRRFAVLAVPHVILRVNPDKRPGRRDNLSELTNDEELWLLDRTSAAAKPAWLVHSSDSYLGWVDEADVKFVDAADFARRLKSHTSDAAQAKIAQAIARATSLTGTPYLWGGKTNAGIDCSGLMQTSYASIGVRLPRDADMQSGVGRLTATRWFRDGMLPGDLIFFLHAKRGHVHHVGMYVGDGKFVESAGKGVAVHSLRKGDPEYQPKRDAEFGWARRVLE